MTVKNDDGYVVRKQADMLTLIQKLHDINTRVLYGESASGMYTLL
jgi:hypothetical protein